MYQSSDYVHACLHLAMFQIFAQDLFLKYEACGPGPQIWGRQILHLLSKWLEELKIDRQSEEVIMKKDY